MSVVSGRPLGWSYPSPTVDDRGGTGTSRGPSWDLKVPSLSDGQGFPWGPGVPRAKPSPRPSPPSCRTGRLINRGNQLFDRITGCPFEPYVPGSLGCGTHPRHPGSSSPSGRRPGGCREGNDEEGADWWGRTDSKLNKTIIYPR